MLKEKVKLTCQSTRENSEMIKENRQGKRKKHRK